MRVFIIKLVLYLCAIIPLPLLHGAGRVIGAMMYAIPNRLKIISTRNIQLCLPELSAEQQRRLVRDSLVETVRTALELGPLWLRPAPRVLRLMRRVDGLEHIEVALAQGHGLILATPHLGCWELAGLYCAHNFDLTCLYRPLRLSGLEGLVNRVRSRAGGRYVPANARGIRTLYRTLEENRVVAMLPDQEPQAGTGVFAPFFGIPAFSMVFLSRLAVKDRTPIVFGWCERLDRGRGYHLRFTPALEAAYSTDLVTSVTAINSTVEQAVRLCPQQYQWSYKRFRTRPDGEAPLYQ